MKLEQWIETTSDWKDNLCVMTNPNRWKRDFREKIIIRLNAVLHQVYPEDSHWFISNPEDASFWENWDSKIENSIHDYVRGEKKSIRYYWNEEELFWGDLVDCELHFLNLLFEVLPNRKELELAKRDKWEKFPVDKRKQLIDAIIDLHKIKKWRLDDESVELIKMRILCPRFYRILKYILELSNMNWPDLYKADFKDSDLLEVEEKLKIVKKILSSYEPTEPADTDIIESQEQIYALIEQVIKERGSNPSKQ